MQSCEANWYSYYIAFRFLSLLVLKNTTKKGKYNAEIDKLIGVVSALQR